MNIGIAHTPGLTTHLTGKSEKRAPKPAAASTEKAAAFDTVTFSADPSTAKLESRLSAVRAKVAEKSEFLSQYEHVPNQVLVRLKDEVGSLSDFAEEYGSKILHRYDLTGLKPSVASSEQLLLLDLKNQLSVAEAMVLLESDPRVSVAESNDIVRTFVEDQPKPDTTEPNDLDSKLWGLNNDGQDNGTAGVDIDVQEAWKTTIGSRTGPIVAVIDSGVDYNHRDLKNNIFKNEGEIPNDGIDNDGNGVIDDIHGYNAAADNTDPKDDNGHGTHVAGTIGAVGNNGQGITGVNQEARILPVRFLSKEGSGTTADAIKALVYASRTGARVVNNSWGGNKYNQIVFDVMHDSECLFVCAAGNEAFDNDLRAVYPADYDLEHVISVTAHDRNDAFPKFANRGEKSVELAAPGVDIYSTYPRNKYETLSGTSMASPHVAGVATLLATQRPEATNEELKFLLMHNLKDLPEQYGSRIISGGRLNAGLALEQDTTAPGSVGELKVTSVDSGKVSLSWTATGDDGEAGQSSAYDLRYTSGQFQSDDHDAGVPFSEARRIKTEQPKKPTEAENLDFELTPSGKERTLSLGIMAVDNVLNKGPVSTLSVTVPAHKVALEDRGESVDDSAFLASEHWTRVEAPDRGLVFTDSADGQYPSERDAVLLSKPFSLKEFKKPILHFDAKFDVEKKHDEFVVEVEKKGWFGKSWKEVGSFDGVSDWKTHKIDISRYTGRDDVKIRFRMVSDRDRNRDGVYLDNIVIAEGADS